MWQRLLYGVLGATLGCIALVVAQTTPIYNLTGRETVNITLESGSGIAIPLNQIRNTQGISPIGAGTTVASSPTGILGYLVAKGSITTWDVSLPNPAYRGQQLFIVADNGTITTLRVSTQTGVQTQTLNTAFSQTLTATSPVGWMYSDSTSTWFRIN